MSSTGPFNHLVFLPSHAWLMFHLRLGIYKNGVHPPSGLPQFIQQSSSKTHMDATTQSPRAGSSSTLQRGKACLNCRCVTPTLASCPRRPSHQDLHTGVARWFISPPYRSAAVFLTTFLFSLPFIRGAMVSARSAAHAIEPIGLMTVSTRTAKAEHAPKCSRTPSRSSKLAYTSWSTPILPLRR